MPDEERRPAQARVMREARAAARLNHPGAVVFDVVQDHGGTQGRTWGYNVELIVPVDEWDATQTLARQFERASQPLG